MGRLQVTDKFIVNRSDDNYQTPFDDVREYFGSFLPGSTCVFFQASAPYDWVIKTDGKYNQATIRVVTGNGGGSGGTQNFTDVFKTWNVPVPTHGHGLGGGTHKHSASFSHGHSLSDPKHGHSTRLAMAMHTHDLRGPNGRVDNSGGVNNPSGDYSSCLRRQGKELFSDGAGGGGGPLAASATGVSVNNAKGTISISDAKINISSTSGTTGTTGTTMNFNILYNNSIVCVKS